MGGAATGLVAYLLEYYPAHMDFEPRVNSPLYGLAWLGLGELLTRYAAWTSGGARQPTLRSWTITGLSAAAVALVPVALWLKGNHGFLADDLQSARPTLLPEGAVAKGLRDWVARDGLSGAFLAASLPLVLLVPAAWSLDSTKTPGRTRSAIAIALGPAAGLAFAFLVTRLRWWGMRSTFF